MKTIGSVLRRLLLALGGSAAENYLNDITLVDRIADLAENGQISSSVIQGGGGGGSGSGIAIQPDPPTGDELVWIDTDDPGVNITIPQIDDSTTSEDDTWSSQKIASKIGSLTAADVGALPDNTITYDTWTPHIYDYETYRRAMAPQFYIKIGRLYVLFLLETPFQSTVFNTMIQIRNSPCPHIWGGIVYVASVSGQGGTWTVQGSGSYIYLRPNYTGTLSGGWFQGVFFGYGD